MQIGIWVGDATVHGVALDGDVVAGYAEAAAAVPATGIRSVLTDLVRIAGPPAAVAYGVDGLLREALQRHTNGRPAVALLQIRPRWPAEPAFSLPAIRLPRTMIRHFDHAAGGHDIFGSTMMPLDLDAVGRAARRWVADGAGAVAVAAAGSLVCPDHELEVAEYLSAGFPELAVWLSHECSGHGLMVREAVTVLQAVLAADGARLADRLDQLTAAVRPGLGSRVMTSDGGRITTERMRNMPLSAVGTDCAALLIGSGLAAGTDTLTVLAVCDGLVRVGRLAGGLPEVAADLPIARDVNPARITTWEVTLPMGELDTRRGAWSEALAGAVVAVVDDGPAAAPAELSEVVRFVRTCSPAELLVQRGSGRMRAAAVAGCEPVIRVQRVAIASTPGQLQAEINRTADRAFSLLAASGGAPGTERVVDVRAAAMRYLLGDTYRLQLRATARALTDHRPEPEGSKTNHQRHAPLNPGRGPA